MAGHGYNYYVKIWVYLMILLVISIAGPALEIFWVTLITAFGVAVVKAMMVASWYMHLNSEKRYIWLLLISALIFLFGLYVGIAPDIQLTKGTNWSRCNAYSDTNRTKMHEEISNAHGEGFGHMDLPHVKYGDCTPQRF